MCSLPLIDPFLDTLRHCWRQATIQGTDGLTIRNNWGSMSYTAALQITAKN